MIISDSNESKPFYVYFFLYCEMVVALSRFPTHIFTFYTHKSPATLWILILLYAEHCFLLTFKRAIWLINKYFLKLIFWKLKTFHFLQWIIPKKQVSICTNRGIVLYNIQRENLVFKKSLCITKQQLKSLNHWELSTPVSIQLKQDLR